MRIREIVGREARRAVGPAVGMLCGAMLVSTVGAQGDRSKQEVVDGCVNEKSGVLRIVQDAKRCDSGESAITLSTGTIAVTSGLPTPTQPRGAQAPSVSTTAPTAPTSVEGIVQLSDGVHINSPSGNASLIVADNGIIMLVTDPGHQGTTFAVRHSDATLFTDSLVSLRPGESELRRARTGSPVAMAGRASSCDGPRPQLCTVLDPGSGRSR